MLRSKPEDVRAFDLGATTPASALQYALGSAFSGVVHGSLDSATAPRARVLRVIIDSQPKY